MPATPPTTDRELLARLMAFEPVTGRPNRAIAEFVADRLAGPGVRVHLEPAHAEDCWNVLAVAGPSAPAPAAEPTGPNDDAADGIMLCGHLDVVPPGDGWSTPPFVLHEDDGHWYGRGTCDMLGFVAVAMNRFAAAASGQPTCPIGLLLTADEERGSLGAAAFADRREAGSIDEPGAGQSDGIRRPPEPLIRPVLIGEPTSLRPVRMHKGHLKLRMHLRGRSAHSGTPELGASAIEAAGRVLVALAELRQTLATERTEVSEAFTTARSPVLNVGRIDGGEAINVVPDRCTIELGIRVMPGQDAPAMAARVQERAEAAATAGAEGPSIAVTWEALGDNPPLLTGAKATVLRRLESHLGPGPDLGVSFASDGGHLARLGLESVLCGPGDMAVAHRPNEHVAVDQIVRCGMLLEALLAGA
ncbi:MAG: M20/M25/M40 family metallo-hydrolase [Phycisphaerales bacterium]